MWATWVFVVASLITSSRQISGLERPRMRRSSTSRSRGVSSPIAVGNSAGTAGARRANSPMTAWVPPASRENPPTIGVRFVCQDRVLNHGAQFGRPAGTPIGRAEGVCTLIAVTRSPQAQCLITAHVPDGQIIVAGEGDPGAKVTHYAVIGGLGAYENAHGWVTGKTLSNTKTLVTIHLAA